MAIMYDKATGQSSGYAFVSFGTRGETDAAIAALDGAVHLPGAHTALQVRYAKNQYGIPLSADSAKLHFSRAPGGASNDVIRELFQRFGKVCVEA